MKLLTVASLITTRFFTLLTPPCREDDFHLHIAATYHSGSEFANNIVRSHMRVLSDIPRCGRGAHYAIKHSRRKEDIIQRRDALSGKPIYDSFVEAERDARTQPRRAHVFLRFCLKSVFITCLASTIGRRRILAQEGYASLLPQHWQKRNLFRA